MKPAMTIMLIVLIASFGRMSAQGRNTDADNAELIHRSVKMVTDVIVYDIYSPPVASRTYAYICIAGYEAALPSNSGYISLAGQLHQLAALPLPDSGKACDYALSAVHAILTVGKALVVSEEKIDAFKTKMMQEFKNRNIPVEVFSNSVAFGQQVADHILAWAAQDKYTQTRSLAKHAVNDEAGSWKPTPPAYIKAIEPHWNKMRTFLIDSAQQFKPVPPTPFSTGRNSRFYKEALAVHDMGLKLTPEQSEIANFWDCNPFKMNVRGHVMYATKKISPNGHWINITRLACRKANAGLMQTTEAYACLSVALADCFISCWDEKYRSNVIRPETFINQYIDPNWVPLLQTPPFPEYTSGHSVISSAAAVVLSRLFGENFSYTDSTEVEFGLPARKFTSFESAAAEAAISRFYGGIHYMPAITNGIQEGKNIGRFFTGKLRTKKEKTALTLQKNLR